MMKPNDISTIFYPYYNANLLWLFMIDIDESTYVSQMSK